MEKKIKKVIHESLTVSLRQSHTEEKRGGTLRTEAKLSACSISEKWRFQRFQSHSKEELLLLLFEQRQRGPGVLRLLLEETPFLAWKEQQPQPRTKFRLALDFLDKKSEQQ